MILGFKTIHKGLETSFVEKILAYVDEELRKIYTPKIHTLREKRGITSNWRKGMKIHMATGVRTAKYFQFNKNIEELSKCKCVQNVFIERKFLYPNFANGNHFWIDVVDEEKNNLCFCVRIDGRYLTKDEIIEFAKNDGFHDYNKLFSWFNYETKKLDLIHWTDKVY